MKVFICAVVVYILARNPFTNPQTSGDWIVDASRILLLFGFVYCFLKDIFQRAYQDKKDD